jgi:hypothetical protein
MSAEQNKLTDWAAKERVTDLAWIQENIHIFHQLALEEYEDYGRGLVVINTLSHIQGQGHAFGYLPQEVVNKLDNEIAKQYVNEYNPKEEIVIALLKPMKHQSTYRVLISNCCGNRA